MALVSTMNGHSEQPRASTSSSVGHSLDLSSLQPLSHDHPLLSAPTFDADSFLLSRIHIPLDELRGELREYLGVLREELVQLINDDYEEFISLGTGLRGESERLTSLELPLAELRQEVEVVRNALQGHQTAVQSKLDERASLREEKALLDLLQRLFDTLTRAESLLEMTDDGDRAKMVARVAGEYTQLVYLVAKARAEQCKLVETISDRIDRIRTSLSTDLSSLLGTCLQNPELAPLRQCLKTYELIEGWEEAEEVVRGAFRTFCRKTVTATSLTSPLSPVVPRTPHATLNPFDRVDRLVDDAPLAALYNRLLSEVEGYQPLMTVAQEVSDNFDIYSRVIWPEISSAIIENLGSVVFAAGRPDELHQHYTTTHAFISLLENMAPSSQAVISMRSSNAYEVFERRWQLPVYFQLRWKEIVGTFEAALVTPGSAGEWSLPQSAAAWKAVQACWAPDVFLPELAHRFWRTTLQVVSRYAGWLKSSVDSIVVPEDDLQLEDSALRLSASAVSDIDLFGAKCAELEVAKSVNISASSDLSTTEYEKRIISILVRRSSETLKLVRSVASQFRAAPSKSSEIVPSYFISSILKPVHTFLDARQSLRNRHGSQWSTQIVDDIFVSYASILASVRKTEDLLRRHRKGKKNAFSLFGNSAASNTVDVAEEEERFKRQMQVDIEALAKDARCLGVEVERLSGWVELQEVVNRPAE